jgi:hypothetical protein
MKWFFIQPISKRFILSGLCGGRLPLRLISRITGKRFENGSICFPFLEKSMTDTLSEMLQR